MQPIHLELTGLQCVCVVLLSFSALLKIEKFHIKLNARYRSLNKYVLQRLFKKSKWVLIAIAKEHYTFRV